MNTGDRVWKFLVDSESSRREWVMCIQHTIKFVSSTHFVYIYSTHNIPTHLLCTCCASTQQISRSFGVLVFCIVCCFQTAPCFSIYTHFGYTTTESIQHNSRSARYHSTPCHSTIRFINIQLHLMQKYQYPESNQTISIRHSTQFHTQQIVIDQT